MEMLSKLSPYSKSLLITATGFLSNRKDLLLSFPGQAYFIYDTYSFHNMQKKTKKHVTYIYTLAPRGYVHTKVKKTKYGIPNFDTTNKQTTNGWR